MSAGSLRRTLTAQFKHAGLESPALDAKLLIMAAANWSAADLILKSDEGLPQGVHQAIEAFAVRRLAGEPIDHILGYRDFYGRRFHISKDVLSPRQDTETLVDIVLRCIAKVKTPLILDLGTGSGAIIISVLAERLDAIGHAVDMSSAALAIARINAERHDVSGRLTLLRGDWLKPVTRRFDVIVSNPPYITDAAMTALPREVTGFDPDLSLRGGADGLEAYRVITSGAARHLTPGGWLVLEIGYDQGVSVSHMLREQSYEAVEIGQDLAGHNRVVFGRKPASS